MTDVWSERAEQYRTSEAHREGPDLDLLVEWAAGARTALEQMSIELPIVVRLDGTNADEGRQILRDAAPPNLSVEPTMLDAAQRAVELAA